MSTFADQWQSPARIMNNIDSATEYELVNSERKFKSGRPMIFVVFKDAGGTMVDRRQGMVLQNRFTQEEYVVCRTRNKLVYTRQSLDDLRHDQTDELYS